MNGQTVDETLGRVDNTPRRPSTTAARNQARDELARRGERDLIREGLPVRETRDAARRYADETFPPRGGGTPEQFTHNPDMHLGGRPETTTHGDGSVNNAFGKMATSERPGFVEHLRQQSRDGKGDSLVNVEIS